MPRPTASPGRRRAGAPSCLRVMLVVHGLSTGGAEVMVLNLARELLGAGHRIQVVCLHEDGTDVAGRLRDAGVDLLCLNKAPGPDPRIIISLAAAVRRLRPTTVHTHLPVLAYVLPALRLSGCRARVLHTVHNLASKETRLRVLRWVNHYAFRRGVVPVALNEEVRESVRRTYRLDAGQIPVVRNGVDIATFRSPRDPAGLPDRPVRLLCVARLEPVKNHALVLEVLQQLTASGRRAELTLVGDGSLRAELEERARSLGVADLVRFAGLRSQTAPFYRRADLFVLLSDYEGLPMSIIEAMAAGLPVVATPAGGVPGIVADGGNGLLVEPDAPGIAASIAALSNDPQRYLALSRGARRTAQGYSATAMMEAYRELYR